MRYIERCPCGARLSIESVTHQAQVVTDWRDHHPCSLRGGAERPGQDHPGVTGNVTDSDIYQWLDQVTM